MHTTVLQHFQIRNTAVMGRSPLLNHLKSVYCQWNLFKVIGLSSDKEFNFFRSISLLGLKGQNLLSMLTPWYSSHLYSHKAWLAKRIQLLFPYCSVQQQGQLAAVMTLGIIKSVILDEQMSRSWVLYFRLQKSNSVALKPYRKCQVIIWF